MRAGDPRAARRAIAIAQAESDVPRAFALARAQGLPEVPEILPPSIAEALFPKTRIPSTFLWAVARAASYHAGKGNVLAWRAADLPPETALYRLPFPESRAFVRDVEAGMLALSWEEE